jgi:hypothetical protein
MKENDYQEIKERLKKELKVVSFKLVDDDEEEERRRQQACEQNGPTGIHYLLDIKYWKPAIEGQTLVIYNGDYSINPHGEANCQYGDHYYNVCHKHKCIGGATDINRALKMAAEHFEMLS